MIDKPVHPEIGRELKVSELKPETIVWVHKMGGQFGNSCATMWVKTVAERHVVFWAGMTGHILLALRIGENFDRITDDSNGTMRIYEYLGEP